MNAIKSKTKEAALAELLEDGASVQKVSERFNISKATLYKWRTEAMQSQELKKEDLAELKQKVKLAALDALNKFISDLNKL
ncbi:transposase [Candidatus Macondimonas diazotrophica]|jgi:transposase-like protein|uniref:Transposase n=1 Tax=Candidatus Macondimonas diazotrophica TaxID=2305248 RepID=A0A4Z0F7I9_9GAMM|nr:transposase [Candidatus Macondimonas diazotrophica]TFZ81677.1 hypothetical protein E4680_11445 [Candidatus Macondimonas diazotrophica]